jgi:hypothetical protein
VASVAAATLSALTVTAAAEGGESSPLRAEQSVIAGGTGKVTGELSFCFYGARGPCGWIVEGEHTGTPIPSGTFFAAIDDGKAVLVTMTANGCATLTLAGHVRSP